MGDRIYLIVSGEYSDWQIHGFVETTEEALKLCMELNKNKNAHDNYYYYCAEKLSLDLCQIQGYFYWYEICAYKGNKEWNFAIEDIIANRKEIFAIEKLRDCNIDYYNIKVSLDTLNDEKALKIAQDMLYKRFAEENNL